MAVPERADDEESKPRTRPTNDDVLGGTTRRVYRYIYRYGPVRLYDIQRGVNLSTPSVANYHVQKLLSTGLIREEGQNGAIGYVAERAIFEAMLRIRRTVIPIWTTATAFFAAGMVLLVTLLRPSIITSTYVFSLAIGSVALAISIYETYRSLGRD